MALVSGVHPMNENLLEVTETPAGRFVVELIFAKREDARELLAAFQEQNMSPREHWEHGRKKAEAAGDLLNPSSAE